MKQTGLLLRIGVLAVCLLAPFAAQRQTPSAHAAAPAMPPLAAVDFVDGRHGWVAGQGIYATSDGGHTWRQQYHGATPIQGLAFVSATTGWAWGQDYQHPPLLLRTTDGGAHWRMAGVPSLGTPPKPAALHFVQFLTPREGVAVAGGYGPGVLVRTTDGGMHWRAMRTPLQPISACVADPLHGWLIAAQGDAILRTTDGGRAWTRTFSAGSDFRSGGQIACTGKNTTWALLYGGVGMNQESYSVYRTSDGGAHWHAVAASETAGGGPAPGHPTGAAHGAPGYGAQLDAVDAGTAYLIGGCPPCGGAGETYLGSTHDGGRTWQSSGALPGFGFGDHALSFPTTKVGWLVGSAANLTAGGGSHGVILATTNGGRSWQAQHIK